MTRITLATYAALSPTLLGYSGRWTAAPVCELR